MNPKFAELKEKYESGAVEWDDISIPETPDKEPIDLTIKTESFSLNTKSPEEKFKELEQEINDSENNSESTDPFIYDTPLKVKNPILDLNEISVSYIQEVLILDWLQLLVDHYSVTDTYLILKYYTEMSWITTQTLEELQKYLTGFGKIHTIDTVKNKENILSKEQHTMSLKYLYCIQDEEIEEKYIKLLCSY